MKCVAPGAENSCRGTTTSEMNYDDEYYAGGQLELVWRGVVLVRAGRRWPGLDLQSSTNPRAAGGDRNQTLWAAQLGPGATHCPRRRSRLSGGHPGAGPAFRLLAVAVSH